MSIGSPLSKRAASARRLPSFGIQVLIGMAVGIDPILDMGRTAINVAGQIVVPTIVAKRAGLLADAPGQRAPGITALTAPAPPSPPPGARAR